MKLHRREGQQKFNTLRLNVSILDDAIWKRFTTVHWLATEDTAMQNKFESLLETRLASADFAKPNSYKNDEMAWEVAVMISKHFRGLLKKRINNSPYFGIMIDETTDVATTQQLIVFIKFLDKNEI
jgi:hypothetical protein